MDNLFLKFQGFHPSEFAQAYLHDKMSLILEHAPHHSYLRGTFTRKGHLFKGIVTVKSSAGKFFAVASGTKLKGVTHKLMEQIRKQLDKWHTQHLQRSSLRQLPFSVGM